MLQNLPTLMAKKAFCQHKSTKMISGVANYFSAPCTLLDTHPPPPLSTPAPNSIGHKRYTYKPPQNLQLPFLLVFVWGGARMVCASSPSNNNNNNHIEYGQHNWAKILLSSSAATTTTNNTQQPQAANEILKFYFHPVIWRFSLSISSPRSLLPLTIFHN